MYLERVGHRRPVQQVLHDEGPPMLHYASRWPAPAPVVRAPSFELLPSALHNPPFLVWDHPLWSLSLRGLFLQGFRPETLDYPEENRVRKEDRETLDQIEIWEEIC